MDRTARQSMALESSAVSRKGRRSWLLLAAGMLVPLVVLGKLAGSRETGPPTEPLPVYAAVPDFTLTERSGRAVGRSDLLGQIWVADFIFTTCAGPCPELTLRMRSLQESLRGHRGAVKLVSFTLDPGYDTPGVLRVYADHYHADPQLWWFLTGKDESSIHTLVQKGFLQTVQPADDANPIIHSTYFVLVGRSGRIRGFYEGLDPESKPRLLRDVEALLKERDADE